MVDMLGVLNNYIDVTSVSDIESIFVQLKTLSKSRTRDLVVDLWSELPEPSDSRSDYRFVGNTSLSGLPFPCIGLDCRTRNVMEMAHFSAIYADEVIAYNPMYALAIRDYDIARSIDDYTIYELAFNIKNLLLLRPLIERNIVTFVDPQRRELCQDCFNRLISGIVNNEQSFLDDDQKDLHSSLLDVFSSNVSVVLRKRLKRRMEFDLYGPEELVGHGPRLFRIHWRSDDDAPRLDIQPGMELSKKDILDLHAADEFANYSLTDIMGSHSQSEEHGINNILSTSKHISILRDYFGPEKFSNGPQIDYPLLTAESLEGVLKFRDKEWHHLHDFRKLVQEGIAGGKDVTAELNDESAKIHGIMAKNSRVLNKSLAKDTAIAAAGVSMTVASAGFSGLVAAVLGVVSGGHIAKDILPKLIDRFSEHEDVRAEKSYFAWKIRGSFLK